MTRREYWEECIATAADECDLPLTAEQLAYIADAVKGSSENIDTAFYSPPSREPSEINRLEAELRKERSKVVCPECKGSGRYFNQGPYHSASGSCFKCHGEGKVLP